MITIETRELELNKVSFKNELRMFARLVKKHNPSLIGIGISQLNEHFKLKLKIADFYKLSEELEFKVHRGKFWYIDDILPSKNES
jgi:hypothetical protein